jgi:hypothetical protein
MEWKLLSNKVNVGQRLNWIKSNFWAKWFLKQNKEVLKWKWGKTCKYINKWGVEYKEHVGRLCEGLRGRRNWVKNHQGPSQTNHKSNREFSKILLEILGLLHGPSTSFFVNFYFYFFFCIFLKRAIPTSTQWGKSIILKMTREKSNAFKRPLKI